MGMCTWGSTLTPHTKTHIATQDSRSLWLCKGGMVGACLCAFFVCCHACSCLHAFAWKGGGAVCASAHLPAWELGWSTARAWTRSWDEDQVEAGLGHMRRPVCMGAYGQVAGMGAPLQHPAVPAPTSVTGRDLRPAGRLSGSRVAAGPRRGRGGRGRHRRPLLQRAGRAHHHSPRPRPAPDPGRGRRPAAAATARPGPGPGSGL